jgi:predicted ATP-grasp superfamily ATP-dependent carboligase
MITKNIFILEFVSGGGYNKLEIPTSLFCEGYAMLRTIIEDFKNLGYEITTLLDERIHHLSLYLKSDEVKYVKKKDDFLTKYSECVKNSTFCFIIAPEFSKILFNLTQIVKRYKKRPLSIDINGILLGTSKFESYKFFKRYKLDTPKTYKIPLKNGTINVEFVLEKFHQLGDSIIIKPDDGVGSELVFHFKTKDQILQFFRDYAEKLDLDRRYIVQEYIEGDDLSISLINITDPKKPEVKKKIILGINNQEIRHLESNPEFLYMGGSTPVKDYELIKSKLEALLNPIDLTNFKGYCGIDFIKKNDNSIYFIEINPRLTTSYIGIRNILDYNPLVLLSDEYNSATKLTELKPGKFSHFVRLELYYSGNETFEDIINVIIPEIIDLVPEIVTPPFTLHNLKINEALPFSCFISTKEKNEKASYGRIAQIKTILKEYNFDLLNC